MKYNKMLRYKACKNSIVTLELLDNTINNEKRNNVVNDKYAKFRCDKAKVVNITNVKTGEPMEHDVSIRDDKFVYSLGEIIETVFNTNIDEVCSEGIHYFKSKEAALSWFYNQNDQNRPDGKWIDWHQNGQKDSEGTIKDEEQDGKWIYWYENGQKLVEGTYKNGIEHGKWIWWESNGNKRSEETFKDGKKDGKRTEWWSNGNKKSEGTYKDGKKDGKWIYWDILGNKME